MALELTHHHNRPSINIYELNQLQSGSEITGASKRIQKSWLSSNGIETMNLRLRLKPTCPGLEPGQNSDWDLNPCGRDSNLAKTHGLPTEITYLVSGLNEAQILDVSSQKEFSERQSDR